LPYSIQVKKRQAFREVGQGRSLDDGAEEEENSVAVVGGAVVATIAGSALTVVVVELCESAASVEVVALALEVVAVACRLD